MLDGLRRRLFGAPDARADHDCRTDPPRPTEAPDASATGQHGVEPTPILGGPGAVVLDVRSEREFAGGAIADAINLPLPQLADRIAGLVPDTSTPLVLYCASGARSGMACMTLRQMGYARVSNAGGLYAAAAQLQREIRR